MRAKRLILFFLIVGLASAGIVSIQKKRTGPPSCDFCERAVCHGTFYRIRLYWGLSKKACCARCGIRYEKENPRRLKESETIDFATGDWVSAQDAVYVEGSDFSHCNPEAILREPQSETLVRAHDRCLPSVVAFKRQEDAQRFTRDHGGRLLTYRSLKENLY